MSTSVRNLIFFAVFLVASLLLLYNRPNRIEVPKYAYLHIIENACDPLRCRLRALCHVFLSVVLWLVEHSARAVLPRRLCLCLALLVA